MSELSELYQQVILDHNKKPRNFKKLETANHIAEGYNPLCGDHLTVYLNLEGDAVKEITFEGTGCAISKAAASMMTQAVKGKSKEDAERLFEEFHRMVKGELDEDVETNHLGNLKIFSLAESLGGVESLIEHPARMTHASVPPEIRKQIGITDSLIRISVGIENIDDLIKDVDQAFKKVD